MTAKRKLRLSADVAMMALLPLLMAYSLLGEAAHEWLGIAIFALFVLHHILNRRFTASIFKGKYTAARTLTTALDVLLLADIFALTVSGVLLSRHVFGFLPVTGGAALARTLHLLGSYWGFALMSLHFGLHIGMLTKALHNRAGRIGSVVLCAAAWAVSLYGLYAFISRGIWKYMILQSQFVFFDFSEPMILFFLDYLAMMTLFALIGHYLMKLLVKSRKKGAST